MSDISNSDKYIKTDLSHEINAAEWERLGKEVAQIEKENGKIELTEKQIQYQIDKENFERTKNEYIQKWEYKELSIAKDEWLQSITTSTKDTYRYAIEDLVKRNLIPTLDGKGNPVTLGHFNYWPHEKVLDNIKELDISEDAKANRKVESYKQVKAAAYISFTNWLNRQTYGWFRKAIPNTNRAAATFYNIYDKCQTSALSLSESYKFIESLEQINHRDALIAKAILQGAKRISEVISINLDQIDWNKNIINFQQSKSGRTLKHIPVNYPIEFMLELKNYIDSTANCRKDSKFVFVTRTGKPVTRLRLNYSFNKAAQKCGIKKISPHVLRATWVTYAKQRGVQDSEIMKVTGHSSSRMIYSYDKTSLEDNYTKKLILI